MLLPDEKMYGEFTRLLAQCYVEEGQWMLDIRDHNMMVSFGLMRGR